MILQVDNQNVDFFSQFKLSLKFDAIASTFSFDFYFNPDNSIHKNLFRPGFKSCKVVHNDEVLVTGTLLATGYFNDASPELNSLAGYATPGILEDCEIPIEAYPLQSDGLNLRQIADKICRAYGLKMVVDPSINNLMSRAFTTSTAKENQNCKSYLVSLAAQLNILVTHTAAGELWFTKARTISNPIMHMDTSKGTIPGTSIRSSYNLQGMHETITVIKDANIDGGNAGQSSINNPYASGTRRSRIRNQNSGGDNTTSEAARNALSEELKNIKLTITTDRWEIDGQILRPNTIIAVTDPANYLYKKTLWFIESIDFSGTPSTDTTATLNLVLPEVYNNHTPKNIFL